MADKKPKDYEGRFFVGVGAVVEHSGSGEILILRKPDDSPVLPGIWELTGGLLSQFEEPEAGLLREIREETGLKIKIVKPIRAFHFYRSRKKAESEMVGITYWCRTGSKRVSLSDEHTAFKWVNPLKAKQFVKHPGILKDIDLFLKEISISRPK